MARTAQDYPITFGYGAKTTINGSPYTHRGLDRSMPTGVPVVVQGVQIGISGNTGLSTGPHLHTQAGKDAWAQNTIHPGAYEFKPGTVVGFRTTDSGSWGKYVRVKNDDGTYVVYAHLSQVTTSVGTRLAGGTNNISGDNEVANRTQVNNIYKAVLHRNGDAGGLNHYTGDNANTIISAMMNSQEFKNQDSFMKTATKQIEDLQKALKNEQNKPAKVVEKEVEKIVEKIVKVEVPVEKEVIVEKPYTWKSVVDWVVEQIKKIRR